MKSSSFLRSLALAGLVVGCGFAASAASAQEATAGKSLALGRGSAAEKIIRGALPLKTELTFVELPLKEALDQIGKKHGIDIQYDVVALRDAAIDPTAIPVSLHVKDISLRSALKLILSQNNLTYVIQDEVLQITTKEKADNTLKTVIYDIHDLAPVRENQRPDFENVTKLIQSTIAPQSWSDVGGPGTAAGFGPASLVVSQTEEVHDEIAAAFAALRKVAELVKAGKTDEVFLYGRTDDEQRFEKALAENVEFHFVETPLVEVAQQIAAKHKLLINYDVVALRDAAIDPTAIPVSLDVRGISLASALRLILSQNNLTIVLRDEVPQITTKDKADATLTTRIYPVADLTTPYAGDEAKNEAEAGANVSALMNIITSTIAAQTWSEVGGPGVLESFDKNGAMLVMSQTNDVHESVVDLLSELRTMRRNQIAVAAQEKAQSQKPETLVLKVYDLRASAPNAPAMTPQEVMETVKGLVEPKSWTQPDVYIRGATGKLIVRQMPSVHRQIEKLLDQLGAQVPKMPSGNSGRPVVGGGGF